MDHDPEKIIADLQICLFSGSKLPKRPSYSISAWGHLSKEEIGLLQQSSVEAIRSTRGAFRRWSEQVQTLGALRYAPAVPFLSDLWRDCAIVPIRASAGHALLAIGDAVAYDALEGLIDDHEHISIFLGVWATFRRDPLAAFERLAPLLGMLDITSTTIAHETLSFLAPSLFTPDGTGHWTERDVPPWLERDPRWLTLCAELCRDERHGDAARTVLRHANRERVLLALDGARAKRAPPPAPMTRARSDLLARYRAGDHLGPWEDARGFAAIAGDLRAEIVALAEETMSRIAYNVGLISERLRREGWITLEPMRTPPEPADAERITTIGQMSGEALPPTLAAFWRCVGGVCWVWDYERDQGPVIHGLDLAGIDTDALCIAPCAAMEPICFGRWNEQLEAIHPDLVGPFELDLSPDRLHKMNISGGAPYTIELPFRGADPPFRQEGRSLLFVDYLRECLAWAGFPHLRHHADQAAARRFIARLGQGLEPF